jgi:hypothetical protein
VAGWLSPAHLHLIYQFKASDGSLIERDLPIGTAPESVRSKGKRFERVYTAPVLRVARNVHLESASLPRWWPYAKDHNPKTGKPRFDSNRALNEAVAASRSTPDEYTREIP